MKVEIPRTIGAAKRSLASLDKVATATEWERAAIVAAFVRESQGQRTSDSSNGSFSIAEFAEQGVAHLGTAVTIRRYLANWDGTGRPRPEPGMSITLPTDPWPATTRSDAQLLGDVKRAVAKHGVATVMQAVGEAHGETPRGKSLQQSVARASKARDAEEEEAGVTDWAFLMQVLDGPAAQFRELAERCLDKGFTDDEARRAGALIAQHVRASADMIDAATDGATALTDDDLDLLRGGTQ